MGQAIRASLVNVQEKKVSEQQMGSKQAIHFSFKSKERNMSVALIEPDLLCSDF
jgi:hypothetical protein